MNERTCAECPADISHLRADAQFCSHRCWSRNYRRRKPAVDQGSYARRRAAVLAQRRAKRVADVDAHRAADRARHERDRAARNKAARERYAASPDKARAIASAWSKSNPDRVGLQRILRRARKQAAGIFVVTEQDWRRLVERYRGCCAYCGKRPQDGKLQREHVIPIVRGGRHSIGNLLPVCQPCNYSKNRLFLTEWRHREGVLARAY